MVKDENIVDELDELAKKKKNRFLKSLESNMYFKSTVFRSVRQFF